MPFRVLSTSTSNVTCLQAISAHPSTDNTSSIGLLVLNVCPKPVVLTLNADQNANSKDGHDGANGSVRVHAVSYVADVNVDGSWTPLPEAGAGFPWSNGPLTPTETTKVFPSLAAVQWPLAPTSLTYLDVDVST